MSAVEPDPVVRIRGRDFTGYRIVAAFVALLLLVALAIQVWELFDGDSRTAPEVSWGSTAEMGGGGTIANEVLVDRTRLQNERYRTGPSPDGAPETFKLGDTVLLSETPLDAPDWILTEAWALPGDDAAAMLRAPERVIGISSLPYVNANLFERPFARDWRLGLADLVTHIGAFAIVGFAFVLAVILALRGRVPIAEGHSGRSVKRFGFVERANHWMTSLSFLMLALTGIAIAYGDTLIRPFGEGLLGQTGWLATWGHMIFAPSFTLGILVMAAMWLHRNLPSRLDLEWLRRAGGFFTDAPDNPPARKFNAGQKLIFWSAVLGGLIMVVTGVVLAFPFLFLGLEGMSWTMLIHAFVAVFLIAIFIGHIYIGTVGMQGAFWAMWGGDVDRNWAREHHDLWLAELEGTPGKDLR